MQGTGGCSDFGGWCKVGSSCAMRKFFACCSVGTWCAGWGYPPPLMSPGSGTARPSSLTSLRGTPPPRLRVGGCEVDEADSAADATAPGVVVGVHAGSGGGVPCAAKLRRRHRPQADAGGHERSRVPHRHRVIVALRARLNLALRPRALTPPRTPVGIHFHRPTA